MKPTDDELEAMAVKFSQAAELSCFLSNDEYRRTAAMLRACKGRVRVKALVWSEGYRPIASPQPYQIWPDNGGSGAPDDPIENFDGVMLYDPHMMTLGIHLSIEAAKAAAQADYEARILAALEPAPGYLDGWNDAREAVADVARKCVYHDAAGTGFEEEEFDAAIRALTPPERPDQ